ncbi:MAG: ABC transporter permease, partial [Methanobrevibacter sp.]|nr:ABC transporter permease [Methanobrevibacter sp.]
SLNPDVYQITLLTLEVSFSATILALIISIPIANLIHFNEFKGKKPLINIIQTLYSMPTVLVGLLLFLLLSRSGPLGSLNLLFTPGGMILGQMTLVLPIVTGLTIAALRGVGPEIKDLSLSLGATNSQMMKTIMAEAKYAIFAGEILGFGRAISEVGVAMMIGGNIRGVTRVITTTMSLETQKGNVELSIALGIILLTIALAVNLLLNYFQEKE